MEEVIIMLLRIFVEGKEVHADEGQKPLFTQSHEAHKEGLDE
jgi:hypothetical protein